MSKKSSILFIVLLIVSVLILTGIGCREKKAEIPTEAPTETLKEEIEEPEEAIPEEEAAWNPVYTNEKYGFSLTFSEVWKDYKVGEGIADWGEYGTCPAITFEVPTKETKFYPSGYASPFVINIFTKEQWEKRASAENPYLAYMLKIGESDFYVFGAEYWQDAPSDLQAKNINPDDVTKTFKVIGEPKIKP